MSPLKRAFKEHMEECDCSVMEIHIFHPKIILPCYTSLAVYENL